MRASEYIEDMPTYVHTYIYIHRCNLMLFDCTVSVHVRLFELCLSSCLQYCSKNQNGSEVDLISVFRW
jgi:hypothetical protein